MVNQYTENNVYLEEAEQLYKQAGELFLRTQSSQVLLLYGECMQKYLLSIIEESDLVDEGEKREYIEQVSLSIDKDDTLRVCEIISNFLTNIVGFDSRSKIHAAISLFNTVKKMNTEYVLEDWIVVVMRGTVAARELRSKMK